MPNVANFKGAAESFVALVARIDAAQWEDPGLGSWTVRSLAGHTTRAILTVEAYLLGDEPGSVMVPTAEVYYSTIHPTLDSGSIESDGVQAGLWLGEDPAATIAAAAARAFSLVESQPPGRILSIGGLGIPMGEYLRTRVLELLLHTVDLSAATGLEQDLPEQAVAHSIALIETAVRYSDHGEGRLLEVLERSSLPGLSAGGSGR